MSNDLAWPRAREGIPEDLLPELCSETKELPWGGEDSRKGMPTERTVYAMISVARARGRAQQNMETQAGHTVLLGGRSPRRVLFYPSLNLQSLSGD